MKKNLSHSPAVQSSVAVARLNYQGIFIENVKII